MAEAPNGCHLVNLWQSAEERSEKYYLVVAHGYPADQTRRMRDWRLSKIERCLHIETPDTSIGGLNHTKARLSRLADHLADTLDENIALQSNSDRV